MKHLLENWRKLINEEVVDFPSEATASERYESYKTHMDSAIEQIKSLEKICEPSLPSVTNHLQNHVHLSVHQM
jgi:hypothetical protein